MKPAFSVIFLTTLIGTGQGLFLALYATELLARLHVLDRPEPIFFFAGSAISLTLLALGLLASFFHLGHPTRAWRAVAMWRTSWLSREVIALPAFMAAVALYGAAHYGSWSYSAALGALALILCFALYICTGMIYACLKFLQEWASPLTVINYILLGSASGWTLATALAAMVAPELVSFHASAATFVALAALLTRSASLVRNARLRPKSTLQSAIGVKHPRIVQKSQGFMCGSFNTRQFFHGKTREFLLAIKWGFLLLVFPLPLGMILLGVTIGSAPLLMAAFVVQYLGLVAERWFFFAQANHPQNLYYQAIS